MVLPQPEARAILDAASALPMRAWHLAFPVETPHAPICTQILNAKSCGGVPDCYLWLPRCMAKSSGDSLERGHSLESGLTGVLAERPGPVRIIGIDPGLR